ncbi:insulin-like growth factor-binding protein 2-A [Gadus macrocephalus]|uniref:insulin-like growth factor-binding protein 2-A n=1 Tax=Gadus macrocephalus TaxID=80720 RepID=UPI0028CB3A2D|nr:insulin-like growth factor-binding protein 2-A [Gadus macrocephalus]
MAPYGTSCVLLLLCLGASLAQMVFRCPACTAERQALCPPPTDTCTEIVREPGCGCCPVCARQEGDFCGVFAPRCSGGPRCYPQPDWELPLEQPVQGQRLCGPRMDPEPPTWSPDAPREHASSGQ